MPLSRRNLLKGVLGAGAIGAVPVSAAPVLFSVQVTVPKEKRNPDVLRKPFNHIYYLSCRETRNGLWDLAQIIYCCMRADGVLQGRAFRLLRPSTVVGGPRPFVEMELREHIQHSSLIILGGRLDDERCGDAVSIGVVHPVASPYGKGLLYCARASVGESVAKVIAEIDFPTPKF